MFVLIKSLSKSEKRYFKLFCTREASGQNYLAGFARLEDVPAHVLTVPALMKADYIFCMVPGKTKAQAIYHTLQSDISEKYPSILRTHPNAVLFVDKESSALTAL